ncbi:MAG: cobyric acid synthase [bacterium]|nr:cobyric acid synthase [bacterium]
MNHSLAILGTGSDVGKSLVTAGLLRLLKRRGWLVAPFKAQNMSNNSGVTWDGLEMGRAQFVQARAAGLEPDVLMNPVLIKPEADHASQLVLRGKPVGRLEGSNFFIRNAELRQAALEDYAQLQARYQNILIEGAGSLAEVNLRSRDFINLGLCQAVRAPALLLADIDRGGVFAQIVGSLEVISPEDRAMIKGILINRFRGSRELFQEGIEWIEQRTGLPVLGLLPFLADHGLPSEDAQSLEYQIDPLPPKGPAVAVIRYPRISNFTDFEPLAEVPGLACHFLSGPRNLSPYGLVILPGSKSSLADLDWLRQSGWLEPLEAYRKAGGKVLGICGGYQMLGQKLEDPEALESPGGGEREGLGLIPMTTSFGREKRLTRTAGTSPLGTAFEGYEIHQGRSFYQGPQRPWLTLTDGPEGWNDGQIFGSYQHGLFESRPFLAEFLEQVMAFSWDADQGGDPYDRLADGLEPHLDLDQIEAILREGL